jgi:hypothetical protein
VAAIILGGLVIAFGGWLLLDKLLEPYFVAEGARAGYQENTRAAIMEQPVVFVGAEECGQCHADVRRDWLYSAHGGVTCEDCHAPGATHIAGGAEMETNPSAELCLNCHTALSARPAAFPQVDAGAHSGGKSCLGCHDPMHPRVASAPGRVHLSYEGLDCTACHDADSPQPAPANHGGWTMEICGQCHREEVTVR